MAAALSTTLYLSAFLLSCWALTFGLTWAPCYSQVCPEQYHPLATRMHIVTYYALLASVLFALLLRAFSSKCRHLSQRLLTTRELPILRKRISVGGLLLALWLIAVVSATTAFWFEPLLDYWRARFVPTGWANQIAQVVLTGIFAHHADMLLGLLLIPVGRKSILSRTFALDQSTLLYAHKLLAYLAILAVLCHGVTYYTFVGDWMAVPFSPENIKKKLAIDLENPNIAMTDVKELGYYYTVSLFTGTVLLALTLVVVFSSLPALRRRAYNAFYYLHIICSSLIFAGAGIHSSTNFYFLLPGLLLWIVDWSWRLFRGDTGLLQRVDGTLEDAGSGWYRIRLSPPINNLPARLVRDLDGVCADEKQAVAHPLQTYHVNIPSVSKLQVHALSAAALGSAATGPVFLFRRISVQGKGICRQKRVMAKEWTWKLASLAGDVQNTETPGVRQLGMRVEGPYFPHDRAFETAGNIICLVGGTGVTGALSLANWFLTHRMHDSEGVCTVIWTVRDAPATLLSEWQALLACSPQTNGRLRLQAHVSSELGRLNASEVIRTELATDGQGRHGSGWVYISGPAGLLTAAEDACCDLESELEAAMKLGVVSDFTVDKLSHFVAKWEV